METLDLHLIDGTINLTYNNSITQIAVMSQTIENPVLEEMEYAWYYFIDSGQVWALLIGLLLGYVFKGFITY